MRFIIDTNQASSFVRTTASHPRTIVIPPLVWAEILVPSSCCHQPRIEAIGEHDILFGMDYPTIYDHLCHMTEGEIREFDPVFPTGSPEHRASCSSFLSPSSKMLERAKQLKQASIQNAEILSSFCCGKPVG
jgi:hypothetical protein